MALEVRMELRSVMAVVYHVSFSVPCVVMCSCWKYRTGMISWYLLQSSMLLDTELSMPTHLFRIRNWRWTGCILSLFHTASPLPFNNTHLFTHPFNGPCPGLPGSAGIRKVKPIWILLKEDTVSGSGITWAVCKSAPRCRQITMPAPHRSVFLQAGCPSSRPTNSVKALKALPFNKLSRNLNAIKQCYR